MTAGSLYPRVRVSGTPRERGRQYGAQTKNRVWASREGYERVFRHATEQTWDQAVASVAHLVDPVNAAFPTFLEEMQGIADGAGLSFDEVFTMNARTEVIWSQQAKQSAGRPMRIPHECTALALLPSRTSEHKSYLGQNWDWLVHSTDSLVVLEVEQPDAPNFVTVVEAGLLAKASMNSAGIGIAVNALVCSLDRAEIGIPFHVLIRAFANARTITEAISIATTNHRSSSGNYLLAHEAGFVVNVETAPGGPRGVALSTPTAGALVHANHFTSQLPDGYDVAMEAMPDSWVRQGRVEEELELLGSHLALLDMFDCFADHADYPTSVCCHPNPADHEDDQWTTVASFVMDLADRRLHLKDGNPCSADVRELDYSDFLAADHQADQHSSALEGMRS